MLTAKIVAEILGTSEKMVVAIAKECGFEKNGNGKWMFSSDKIDAIKAKLTK